MSSEVGDAYRSRRFPSAPPVALAVLAGAAEHVLEGSKAPFRSCASCRLSCVPISAVGWAIPVRWDSGSPLGCLRTELGPEVARKVKSFHASYQYSHILLGPLV